MKCGCGSGGKRLCQCDMMFVMDGSGSINKKEGAELVQFIKDVVTMLGDLGGHDIVYGSVVFATKAKVQTSLALQQDWQSFVNGVWLDRANLGYTTQTHKGINLAVQELQNYGRNGTC